MFSALSSQTLSHQYFYHGALSPSFSNYNIPMRKSCLKYLSILPGSHICLTCLELFLIFLGCDRNFRSQLSLTNSHRAASADGDKPYHGKVGTKSRKKLNKVGEVSATLNALQYAVSANGDKTYRGLIQDIHNDQTSLWQRKTMTSYIF